MSSLALTAAVRTYGHTVAVKSGQIAVAGATLAFSDVEPQVLAYRRMVRELAYDICELAPTTYLIAKARGVPITALPVFLDRQFHHAGLIVRPDSAIAVPKDLEGKKVGVRAYTVTTGVWTRGILVNDYGLDASKVTWVVDDEEHIEGLKLPSNVRHVGPNQSLASMIAAGELDAAFTGKAGIGRQGPPRSGWEAAVLPPMSDYRELFPDPIPLSRDWFQRTGAYPMHATLAIKDTVLAAHPWIAKALFEAFYTAKEKYIAWLRSGSAGGANSLRYIEQMKIVGADPLPYGWAANASSIETLTLYAFQQGLIPRKLSMDELFVHLDV